MKKKRKRYLLLIYNWKFIDLLAFELDSFIWFIVLWLTTYCNVLYVRCT